MNIVKSLLRRLRNLNLAKKSKSKINRGAITNKFTFLEGHNKIGDANVKNTKFGFGSYIVSGNASNGEIGRFTSIGHNFKVLIANHPIGFVSTYPGFYKTSNKDIFLTKSTKEFKEFLQLEDGKSFRVGNDVWIGDNVTIMGGVNISDGCVIGANALVVKDTVPYGIYGGVPAKLIKFRFDEATIKKLTAIKWWSWNQNEIIEGSKFFGEVETFINYALNRPEN